MFLQRVCSEMMLVDYYTLAVAGQEAPVACQEIGPIDDLGVLKTEAAYLSVTNSSQNNRLFLDVSTTLSNMYVFSSCMPRIWANAVASRRWHQAVLCLLRPKEQPKRKNEVMTVLTVGFST